MFSDRVPYPLVDFYSLTKASVASLVETSRATARYFGLDEVPLTSHALNETLNFRRDHMSVRSNHCASLL